MPGLPKHIVQKLNVGTVHSRTSRDENPKSRDPLWPSGYDDKRSFSLQKDLKPLMGIEQRLEPVNSHLGDRHCNHYAMADPWTALPRNKRVGK